MASEEYRAGEAEVRSGISRFVAQVAVYIGVLALSVGVIRLVAGLSPRGGFTDQALSNFLVIWGAVILVMGYATLRKLGVAVQSSAVPPQNLRPTLEFKVVESILTVRVRLTQWGAHLASPGLPIVNGILPEALSVESSSHPGTHYEVNLNALTCTCPNFVRLRQEVPPTSFGRMCKHLAARYRLLVPEGASTELILAILGAGHMKVDHRIARLASGGTVVLGFDPDREWCDVFARRRRAGERGGSYTGLFARYGFNLLERRWSYGDGPDGAREIRRLIEAAIEVEVQ